jgi:CRP-like cAMP-binding protein
MFTEADLNKIQKICRISPDYRKPHQLEYLLSCVRNIKLFKDLQQKHGDSSLLSCCQHLHHEFISANEPVFRYGDVGTKFYIVLTGAVIIYIPTADSGRIVYKEIMTFTSGSSFGELALENSKPRSASAVCKADSHFLVLLQKDYLKFMQRLVIDKKNEMISFLHSLPAFSKMNKLAISKLTYNIKEIACTKGQSIFSEGDPANEIFIVKDGECKLTKVISKPSSSIGIRKVITKRIYTAKRVGRGSMIAEDDIFNKQSHSYSCICSSDIAFLYVIPSEDFFIRITSEQPLKFMKKVSKEKKSFLEGWSSYRSNLDLIFGKSVEVKERVKKKKLPEIDNIQKLKKALLDRLNEKNNESELVPPFPHVPLTPQYSSSHLKTHKKFHSTANFFSLTGPKLINL